MSIFKFWVLGNDSASDCQRWHPLLLRSVGQWQSSSLGLAVGGSQVGFMFLRFHPFVTCSFWGFYLIFLKNEIVDVGNVFPRLKNSNRL